MRALYRALGTAAGISILAACTGGQSGIEPPAQVDQTVQTSRQLQFRVGTATYRGVTYLNTLATFRQTNGLSGTLYNTPTITGPAGFSVAPFGIGNPTASSTSAGTDLGTNHISGTPPTQPGTTAVLTTFNQAGGVFAYAIAPGNSTTSGAPQYPNNTGVGSTYNTGGGGCVMCGFIGPFGVLFDVYAQPVFLPSNRKLPFLLGPPAVPDFHDGTFPTAFLGYDSGFLAFGVQPIAGVYSLHVVVPSATIGVNTAVFDTTATLTTVAGLGAQATPVVTLPTDPITTRTTNTVTITVPPAGVGATNQLLYMVDVNGCTPTSTPPALTCQGTANTPTFYTAVIPAAGGTFVLTPTSGPKQPNGSGGFPIQSGDYFAAWTVGSDYNVLAAAVPLNLQQTPALPAQADITISVPNQNIVP